MKGGKDKTPNPAQQFDPAQAGYSPQNPQAPGGYPGTPSTYFPQYGGKSWIYSNPQWPTGLT